MVSNRTKFESSAGIATVERRKYPRYSFTASAEVTETRSGARIQGRLSDLGRGGCYVDAMSPFGVGSEVSMRIVVESKTFTAPARVVFAAPGMGMGLMFTGVEPGQLPVLDTWLAQLSGEALPEPPGAKQETLSEKPATEQAQEAPRREQNYVLNELIIALMRKNVLSDSEGKGLLQKLLQ
jgi:hypothetical protein